MRHISDVLAEIMSKLEDKNVTDKKLTVEEYESILWANDAKKKIAELSELLREIADTKRHLYARSPEGREYMDRIDAALDDRRV